MGELMSGIEKSFSLKLSIQCQTLSRYHSFPKEVPAAVALYLEENNILMLWRVIVTLLPEWDFPRFFCF